MRTASEDGGKGVVESARDILSHHIYKYITEQIM